MEQRHWHDTECGVGKWGPFAVMGKQVATNYQKEHETGRKTKAGTQDQGS